mgnify:CR=1 FL=1
MPMNAFTGAFGTTVLLLPSPQSFVALLPRELAHFFSLDPETVTVQPLALWCRSHPVRFERKIIQKKEREEERMRENRE